MRSSFFARIVDAGTTLVDERLYGYVTLQRRDGNKSNYLITLPRAVQPSPPGWESLEALTGVTADEVIASWIDLTNNPAAERLMEGLKAKLGQELLAYEISGFQDLAGVELMSLAVNAKIVDEAPPKPALVVRRIQILSSMLVLDPTLVLAPHVRIEQSDGQATLISVPDIEVDESPDDWWVVEVITEVPASRIARGWSPLAGAGSMKHNVLLSATVPIFDRLTRGIEVSVKADGTIDLDELLRVIVYRRYSTEERKPVLYVGADPRRVIQRTWRLLHAIYGQVVFRYHAQAGHQLGRPAIVVEIDGRLKLEVLEDKDSLRGMLIRAVGFMQPSDRGARALVPPEYVVLDLLRFAHPSVRPIDGLVRTPTLRPDGKVHDSPGYDNLTRLWYAPDAPIDPIPANIRGADVRRAVATLLTPFRQFPFVDESGLAGTIACLLEQIVRPMISGPRPLYVFDAPGFRGQGSGKSLIARTIGAIVMGREPAVTPWPDSSEEVAKTITSKLYDGHTFVIFDNLVGTVQSAHLAALTTSGSWSPRVLHSMKSPELPQNATWCATLNGGTFSRDLARRIVLIQINAKMADPFARKNFDVTELVPWVIQHRPSLLRAALVLARAWVLAGQPHDQELVMGSFEAWARVIGGIVSYAGLPGLSRAVEASRGRDVDTVEYETLIARWWDVHRDQPVSAGDVANVAAHYSLFAVALDAVRSPSARGRKMSEILQRLVGHDFTVPDHGEIRVYRRDTLLNGHTVFYLGRPSVAVPSPVRLVLN